MLSNIIYYFFIFLLLTKTRVSRRSLTLRGKFRSIVLVDNSCQLFSNASDALDVLSFDKGRTAWVSKAKDFPYDLRSFRLDEFSQTFRAYHYSSRNVRARNIETLPRPSTFRSYADLSYDDDDDFDWGRPNDAPLYRSMKRNVRYNCPTPVNS